MCPSLVPEAKEITEKYSKGFHLFSKCHNIYNCGKFNVESSTLGQSVLDIQLTSTFQYDRLFINSGSDIDAFMSFYRSTFPNSSVTPKMHMMEQHMVKQLTTWRFGMGLLGEQGAESIHASFNSIQRVYSGIPSNKDRLLRVTQEHHLKVDPENISIAPVPKKRKIT